MPLALDAQKERQHQAEELLNDTARSIQEAHPTMTVNVRVIEGLVKESILEAAKEIGADMIVLGSHGRKGITKLFLGSVSEHVLAQANCSVEIVKT
jgi:nucleotide-binding universal stress UspA family protein